MTMATKERWAGLRSGGLVPVPVSPGSLLDTEDVALRLQADEGRFEHGLFDDDLFEDELLRESLENTSSVPDGGPPERVPLMSSQLPALRRARRAGASAPRPGVGPAVGPAARPLVEGPRGRARPVAPAPVGPVAVPSRPSVQPSLLRRRAGLPDAGPPPASRRPVSRVPVISAPRVSVPAAQPARSTTVEQDVRRRIASLAARQWATEGETYRMLEEADRVMAKARAVNRPEAEIASSGMVAARRVAPILPKQGMLVPSLGAEERPSPVLLAAARLGEAYAGRPGVRWVAQARHRPGINVFVGPGRVPRFPRKYDGFPVYVHRQSFDRPSFEAALESARDLYVGKPNVLSVDADEDGRTIVVWLQSPYSSTTVPDSHEGWPMRADIVAGSAAKLPAPRPTGGGKLMPIFEPEHNFREIAKQLVLLEDHLVHPPKRCPDCIRKHLLTAEALAEEAGTLDKTGKFRSITETLPQRLRGIAQRFLSGADKASLAQEVRVIRKQLSKSSFGAVMMDTTAIVSGEIAFDGDDLLGEDLLGDVALPSKPTSPAGTTGTTGGGLAVGQEVLYPGQDAQGNPSWSLGLLRGSVVGVGETVAGYPVEAVPQVDAQGTWYGLRNVADGGEAWRTSRYVVPLAADPTGLFSEFLAGKGGTRYRAGPGPAYKFVFDGKMARMADLIQSVFFQVIPGRWCVAPTGSSSVRMDLPACLYEVPRKLALAAVINAVYESHLNPDAVGDSGRAVGLFQLHDAGAGAGMTVAARKDPVINTETIAKVALKALANPKSELNRLARAEVDGVGEPVSKWAAAFSKEVERPDNGDIEAINRARTTAEVLGETPAAQAASDAVVRAIVPPAPALPPIPASPALQPLPARVLTREDLDTVARDSRRLEQFRQTWASDAGVRSAIEGALFTEKTVSPGAAAERWRLLASHTGDEWALLRAISLYGQAGDAQGLYQAFGDLLTYPRSPFLEIARTERARMEQASPRAFLNAPPPGREKKIGWAVAGGTLAAAALLAAASFMTPPASARGVK